MPFWRCIILGVFALASSAGAAPASKSADPDITRAEYRRLRKRVLPFTLTTRYPNGNPKVSGTFVTRKRKVYPLGAVQIWHPNGTLYQRFDPQTNTLSTYDSQGVLISEEVDAQEVGAECITTRYYSNGQLQTRVVERHKRLKRWFRLTYRFGELNEKTSIRKLPHLERYSGRFVLKEGWHPNGQRHFVARVDPNAKTPAERRPVYTYFSTEGRPQPDTRYVYTKRGAQKWGAHRTYFRNGQVESVIEYVANQQSGRTRRYAENGQLIEDGVWTAGKVDHLVRRDPAGRLVEWIENGGAVRGKLNAEGRLRVYQAQFKEGSFSYVDDPNQRATRIQLPYAKRAVTSKPGAPFEHRFELEDGRPVGTWVISRKGALIAELHFDDRGRLHGRARQWLRHNDRGVDCTFEHGEARGPISVGHVNGKPAMKGSLGPDGFVGEYETWHDNGTRRSHSILGVGVPQVIGQWTKDGQAEAVGLQEGDAFVTRFFRKGVLSSAQTRTPGRRTADTDTFDAQGRIARRVEHVADDPKRTIVKTFWPDGTLKSLGYAVDKRPRGIVTTWHANGQQATRVEHDAQGRRQGLMVSWTPDGKRAADQQYVDDALRVRPTGEACFCDTAYKAPQRFINPADFFMRERTIEHVTGWQLEGYDNTFLRYDSLPNYQFTSGVLISLKPLTLNSKGLTVHLNPCRHGPNHSQIPVTGGGRRDGVHVELKPEHVALIFPKVILRFESGDDAFSARFDGVTLSQTPRQGITATQARSVCMPTARVAQTPLLLMIDEPRIQSTREGAFSMAVPRARFAFEAHDGTIFKGDVSALMADGRHLTARLSADGERDLEGPRPHLTAAGFEVTGGPVLQVRWQPPAPPEEVPKKKEPKRQQIRDPY